MDGRRAQTRRMGQVVAHEARVVRLRRIYAAGCIFYTVLMHGFLGFLLLIHTLGDR